MIFKRLKAKFQGLEQREVPQTIPLTKAVSREKNKLYQGEVLTAGGTIVSYPAAERFRMLRAKIERANLKDKRYHVLAVTSAAPAEGKSVVSVNFARALSIDPLGKTLLIDCDLRKPTGHRFFGIDQAPGLSDVLNNRNLLPHVKHQVSPGLDVIAAGTALPDPTELLERPDLAQLLDELRKEYRYIVLDCPPTLLCSEMMAISTVVDSTILVVRAWQTPKKLINEAVGMIGKSRILGVVMNDGMDATKQYLDYGYYGYRDKDGLPETENEPTAQNG